jgi:hypothetical protein
MNATNWFDTHGTKVLAVLLAIATALEALDPAVLTGTLGPKAPLWITLAATIFAAAHAVVSATNTTPPTPPPAAGKPAGGFVRLELAAILAIMAVAAGCAALGITQPLTFNEQLAAGYQSDAGIATTADQLLKAGKISAADAQNVETQAVNLREALDIANMVEATDAATGGNKLQAAITAINALVTYLATFK